MADLTPFSLIDAASSVSANNDRMALTLVNRNADEPETVEVVLRDLAFGGTAEIRTVTEGREDDTRALSDVEKVRIEEGTENTKDGTVVITLPPKSFSTIEAAMTSR